MLAVACLAGAPAVAAAQDGAKPAAACSEGVITSIVLDRRSVFDPESTNIGALAWTYRALNVFHVRTAADFIRGELLFREGDCLDPFLLSESERLLDLYGFLSGASITHEDDGSGGQRVLVSTRDEWSTQLDLGVTYDEGFNLERLQVTEENFLGRGIFAEFTHRERREVKRESFGLATPRFFGRADASIAWGRDRPGHFFDQYVHYPFVGEAGTYSVREGYSRGTVFFSYSTDGSTEPFNQVLVPAYRELIELSSGRRFGPPGRSLIAGLSLTRDVVDFPRVPLVGSTSYDDLQEWAGPLPAGLGRQLRPTAATRIALQLGTRRYHYVEYVGLDGVRERQDASLGFFAGLTLGKGLDIGTPDDVEGLWDTYGRVHASFGIPVGTSLLHGGVTAETRRDEGAWRDVLVDADFVSYLRNASLPAHTIFFRASVAGGWNTELPYQLTLGGRAGVRSLVEDRYPGGRMARFVLEDRVVLPWPAPDAADLGLTLFSDLGRVWPGDVPWGLDSGWVAGVGFGLRIGVPARTRNVWRTDIVFPIGDTSTEPIIRITYELNRLRSGFFTGDVLRSRRLNLGPDQF